MHTRYLFRLDYHSYFYLSIHSIQMHDSVRSDKGHPPHYNKTQRLPGSAASIAHTYTTRGAPIECCAKFQSQQTGWKSLAKTSPLHEEG